MRRVESPAPGDERHHANALADRRPRELAAPLEQSPPSGETEPADPWSDEMYGVSDVDHGRLPVIRSLSCKSIVSNDI